MNFKHFYNESVVDDLGKIGSIRSMTEDELIKIGMQFEGEPISDTLDYNKGWVVTTKSGGHVSYIVSYLPRKNNDCIGYSFYKVEASPKFYISGEVHKDSKTGEAIKQFDLINGLKGDAKDTWNDILEEEFGNYYKVLRRATDEEINNYLKRGYTLPEHLKGAWLMHIIEGTEDRNNLVLYIPNRGDFPYVLYMPDEYIFDGSVKEDSPVAKAIEHFELTSGISDQAKDTWSDILEFEQIVLEAIEPLWHVRYASPKQVKKLMDRRKQGGLLDFTKVWVVTTKSNGVSGLFVKSKEKKDTIEMFNPGNYDWYGSMYPGYDIYDTIMHWELTQGLKGSAKDTWEDVLESKDKERYKLKVTYQDGSSQFFKEGDTLEGVYDSEDIIIDEIDKKENSITVSDHKDWYTWTIDLNNKKDLDQLDEMDINMEIIDTLVQGLTPNAKETWEDVLESKNNSITVIREANNEELAEADHYFLFHDPDMLVKPIDKGWIVKCQGNEYRIFPNYVRHMQPYLDDQAFVMFTHHGRWINYSTDRVPTNILKNSDLKQAIRHFELTQGLKGKAKDTWEDILS